MEVSYALAVVAAATNATSNILQRKANREEPPELSMRVGLILDLMKRPVWLAGVLAVVISFLLQAAALHTGRLAAVQPILVLELPMTLLVASKVFRGRLHSREWLAIAVMTAGLAGLILSLAPAVGNDGRAPLLTWMIGGVATIGAAGVCVVASSHGGPARRPALLGVASGIMFGLTAALMKGGVSGTHHDGLAAIFERWQTYAMVAVGLGAFFLLQNALQAGRLLAAQPGITLADPAIAILWGAIVFHEHTRGGWFLLGAAVAAVAIGAGTVILSHSPVLNQEGGQRSTPVGKQ